MVGSHLSKYTTGDVRDISVTDLDMDWYEFQGYYIFMLFAVHHPPYNITTLFIELSKEGECLPVGPGLFTFCYIYFVFFMNSVLRVGCFSVYSALY
jgi:hypothetical protein